MTIQSYIADGTRSTLEFRDNRLHTLQLSAVMPCQKPCIFNSRTVQMILCAMLRSSIAHSIICTRLFRGKMHSDWFNGIEILQGRRQHGEKVGYCYPSGLEKTLCKWDIYTYVPLVTKGLNVIFRRWHTFRPLSYASFEVFHNNVIEESGLWLFRLGTFQNGDNMFVRNVGAYLPSVTYRNVDYWAMPHTWTSHGLHLL